MIIASNHLLVTTHIKIPKDVVVRVNIAWLDSKKDLLNLLGSLTHDVYLDYPQGRTKPPRPVTKLSDAIKTARKFKNVKHFAVSNVEDPAAIHAIRIQLPDRIGLVPKIETRKGVQELEAIIKKIGARYIMLDKEDLYLDVKKDSREFERLVESVRAKCTRLGVGALELQGVVFSPRAHRPKR
ncbi:MAG: hypothetical protein ABSF56_02030 [Minisyncoccia bacterium]|jgi:hypothetical protein